MNHCKLMAILAVAGSLAGCVSSGNTLILDESRVSQVKEGLTKDQVRNLIGEPEGMSTNNKTEVWSYMHTEAQANAASFIPIVGLFAGGATGRSSSLILVFDADGKVQTINRSHGTNQINY